MAEKKKKILITGSQGYIGSVLVPYLRENNFDCFGYDAGFFKDCLLYPALDGAVIPGDMRSFSLDNLKDVEAVVHLAAISNDPLKGLESKTIYNPVREYSLELAQSCKRRGIKFIFASSCSVYGKGGENILTEDSPTDPQTPYSLNKLQIETDLKKISDENFSPIILRFATLFGLSPRIRFDLFINMLTAMAFTTKKIVLNSNGLAWRPNVHILDVCKAIKYALDFTNKTNRPLILNVGDTKENFKIIDIARMIQSAVPGTTIQYLQEQKNNFAGKDLILDRKIKNAVDARTYRISFEKIKNTFKNFRCDWSVERGIKQMLIDFKKLNLTEKKFKNINFYRLQKIEYLLQNGYISKDLYWQGGKKI